MRYGQKLTAIREVLMAEWDPIGVRGEDAARDEYDNYLPVILGLLERDATTEEIAKYLTDVTTLDMRLVEAATRDRTVAQSLLRLKPL